MPHKRAKRSIREKLRSERGSDQVPFPGQTSKQAISSEPIPKSLSRVLNAAHVRQEWKEKKRKLPSGEDIGEPTGKSKKRRVDTGDDVSLETKDKMKASGIQPGESLAHFNRRIEDDMRPVVKSAIQSSSAQVRKVKKLEIKVKSQSSKHSRHTDPSPPPTTQSKHPARATEFQKTSTSAPRRLNDIAHAPPEFKNLPRGAEDKSKNNYGGVISMKQKMMMEDEREKAIVRYRALKERRRAAVAVIRSR